MSVENTSNTSSSGQHDRPVSNERDASALEALIDDAIKYGSVRLSGTFAIDRAVRLDRTVFIEGQPDDPPVIWLTAPGAHLHISAHGCRVANIIVVGRGFHNGTMLQISDASGVTLENVGIVGTQGVGLRARHCSDLTIEGFEALAIGGEAMVIEDCRGIRITATCRNIARTRRAPALRLRGCSTADLSVTAMDVSGAAVSINVPPSGLLDCRLNVAAVSCERAAFVFARAHSPATGLEVRARVANAGDCAVQLNNIDGALVDVISAAADGIPALRAEGAYGIRNSKITYAGGAIALGERSAGRNRITERPLDPASVPCERHVGLSERVTAALAARGERLVVPHEVEGVCSVCGSAARFRCSHPAERESFGCPNCGASLRFRGQAEVIMDVVREMQPQASTQGCLAEFAAAGGLADLAIYEPGVSGPLRPHLRQAGKYRQSVYDPELLTEAQNAEGLEHQDLMALTYPDCSFDLVVTSEIFEHIRKPIIAFREVYRVLKPGGSHIFTIPFVWPVPEITRPRVDTSGPEDRFLLPPVYHGAGGGGRSLVYTDFGRDLGQMLREIGFVTRMVRHPGRDPDRAATVTIVSQREN